MYKPFKLDNIKKLSRYEVDLLRALYNYLPATDARDKVHVAIRKTLIKHLGQDIRYFASSVDRKEYNQFITSLPEDPLLFVVGLAPIDKKLLVYVDHEIADLVVGKLLGGGEEMSGDINSLTETEQGVLQYLVMQVLEQIYSVVGEEPRVHFRFEKFLSEALDIQKLVDGKESAYILNIDISIGDKSGYLKLVFPDPFLGKISNLSAIRGDTKSEREYFRRQLARWGYVKTSVWAEVGNSLLSPVEMKDLEAGDVVLFDEINIRLVGKMPEGKVVIHFGSSERVVDAELVGSNEKSIKCKLC